MTLPEFSDLFAALPARAARFEAQRAVYAAGGPAALVACCQAQLTQLAAPQIDPRLSALAAVARR